MVFAIAVFAPLLGALVAGLGGRALGDRAAQAVTIALMVLAAVCGVASFARMYAGAEPGVVSLGTWVEAGDFHVDWALRYDALSAIMVGMVTLIATLIHVYSVGYMEHEPRKFRFFAYLSLFTFAMLMLVTADNLLQLFFGWEGVGLASYLLIGYWYERPAAQAAAMKAFIVNRVGDLFFAVGIALVFLAFGTIQFTEIFAAVAEHSGDTYQVLGADLPVLEVIGVLLFLGAMGKSAQIGLHVWLPDAMEGPTPVSALIHAATMVTAGVFLVARMSPLLTDAPFSLGLITVVGATTALFAATIGCLQNDIKRVIAYSTCSQLGYMFVASGVGAYGVSIFHLFTHAFFKALLFLGAGSVIHAMSGEQDMRRMGGIWRAIPLTYAMMWIGNLALAGMPPFAGFYSKDAIIEAAYASGTAAGAYGFVCTLVAAFLTAFYSWRLLILTFHGAPRADAHTMEHLHESPWVMTGPLLVLAAGATLAGLVFVDPLTGPRMGDFWRGAIAGAVEREGPWLVALLPTIAGVLGIGLAYVMYVRRPGMAEAWAARFPAVYDFVFNKWYFDEAYDRVFVRPAMTLARWLWQTADTKLIDGMPNGAAALAADGSRGAVRLQTGSIAQYAFVMLIGVVVLVSTLLVIR